MSVVTNRRQDYSSDILIQRYGPVIHGFGPPADWIGHVGNMYIDKVASVLYVKRAATGQGSWYAYLFSIPGILLNVLNWYGVEPPSDDLGSNGDYFVQYQSSNFSVFPLLIGPKSNGAWPTSGEGTPVPFQWNQLAFYFIGIGSEALSHETIDVTPLIYIGIGSEALGVNLNTQFITPVGVTTQGSPTVNWTLNPQGA